MSGEYSIIDWAVIIFGAVCFIIWAAPRVIDFFNDTCYELAKANGETVGGLSDKYFNEFLMMTPEQANQVRALPYDQQERVLRKIREIGYINL